MILERSKTLQIENSALRMEKEKFSKELADSKYQLAEKMNECDKQNILISGKSLTYRPLVRSSFS